MRRIVPLVLSAFAAFSFAACDQILDRLPLDWDDDDPPVVKVVPDSLPAPPRTDPIIISICCPPTDYTIRMRAHFSRELMWPTIDSVCRTSNLSAVTTLRHVGQPSGPPVIADTGATSTGILVELTHGYMYNRAYFEKKGRLLRKRSGGLVDFVTVTEVGYLDRFVVNGVAYMPHR